MIDALDHRVVVEHPAAGGAGTWNRAGAEGLYDELLAQADAQVGQLFDALMRGWHVLPLGLYRRVHPATGHKVNPQTAAALQLAAGPPAADGAFVFNRALVGYVYTSPPADATLSETNPADPNEPTVV
jgi:hypothetical protein